MSKMDRGIIRQVAVGFVCNLLIIDCGLHEGWSTPSIPKFNHEDPLLVDDEQVSWIVNLMYVGVGFGSLAPLFLMDRIGRKRTLLLAAIPKIASWLLLGLADSVAMIYSARLCAGVGCGITYAVMPMYLGEVTSKRTRGPLGTMMAVLLNIGMLLVYAVGLWVSRFTLATMAIWVPILFILSFAWIPESSVYLTRKNRLVLAERTLQWSLAKENVNEELEEIKRIVASDSQCAKLDLRSTIKDIVLRRENRRAFGIALILLSALTLTGAAPILAFQSYIFDEAGFEISTNLSIVTTGLAIELAGIGCVLLVKLTGKRRLLLISAPACVLSLGAIALFFACKQLQLDVSAFKWVPTVFVVLYVLGYGLALNPIPLAYVGEIFPFEIKVPAAIFSSLYYALTSTAVVKFYQVLQDVYGTHAPFWAFMTVTFVLWLFIYLFVPETEGKTLEEIQLELRRKK